MSEVYCKKDFPGVPMVGFRNGKNLKVLLKYYYYYYLERAGLPKIDNFGVSEPFEKGTYQVCDCVIRTNTFTKKTMPCKEVFKIESESANCDLEKVIYRMKCEVYDDKPCFWKKKTNSPFRFNNYKYRLLGKINRMSHESVFILTVVHIATNLLMVGKSLYLRNVKPTNNLKKDEIFGNTN